MDQISITCENGLMTVFFKDHIDSSNAPLVEKELVETRANSTFEKTIIDAKDLIYISSAGLRIILRLLKEDKGLKLVNVSSDVYEILDTTGFTEMMTVEKAYKQVSVEGSEVIGWGSNGTVYRLGADEIIKVYNNPDSLDDIQRERDLAHKAFVKGIPTAMSYDIVRVGNSYGSVFECLNAKSFSKLIAANPEDVDKYIGMYVDLLKTIHGTELKPGDMPDMKRTALHWAEYLKGHISDSAYDKLISLIEAVPECNKMMHGDYHTKNVMLQDGEPLLIDMDTLAMGHPVFEFASVFNAYVGFSEADHSISESFMGLPYDVCLHIWDKTLRLYFNTDDEKIIDDVAKKSMIVGYTRLLRRTLRREADTELGKKRIEQCTRHLEELIPQVDSLDFNY